MGADPDVILAVARAAESSGFATLWAGEHIVMVGVGTGWSRFPRRPEFPSTTRSSVVSSFLVGG